jgi:PIN domain nuclease of toxin-antitoxin system
VRLLLDTHAFLWWLDDPQLLADAARIEIANPRNAVFVSAVCIQEIVLKQARNKLTCPDPILPLIAENRFTPLPITLDHAQAVRDLPPLHKDPFDRQLVAQARVEGMTFVTRDGTLAGYGVPVLAA